jgi:hypothetical protein
MFCAPRPKSCCASAVRLLPRSSDPSPSATLNSVAPRSFASWLTSRFVIPSRCSVSSAFSSPWRALSCVVASFVSDMFAAFASMPRCLKTDASPLDRPMSSRLRFSASVALPRSAVVLTAFFAPATVA